MYTVFWLGNLKGRNHSEDPHIDGRIMLDWISGKWDGRIMFDWMHLAQDRDQW